MYYMYYRIRRLFKKHKIPLKIYVIKNTTPWMSYSLQTYTADDQMKMMDDHHDLMPDLHALRVWLQRRYHQEAEWECHKLRDMAATSTSLRWPGNRHTNGQATKPYTSQRGRCPDSSQVELKKTQKSGWPLQAGRGLRPLPMPPRWVPGEAELPMKHWQGGLHIAFRHAALP